MLWRNAGSPCTARSPQEYSGQDAGKALSKMTAPRCRCLRDGQVVELEAKTLVPGDVVPLTTGDVMWPGVQRAGGPADHVYGVWEM